MILGGMGGMGGGGMGGVGLMGGGSMFPPAAPVERRTAEEIKLATAIRDRLVQPVEFQIDTIPLAKLAEYLSQQTELPFMLDLSGIRYAKVDESTAITYQSKGNPLKVALRQILEPLGLQADIRDDSVVITADFAALSRQGHPTSQWLSVSEGIYEEIQQALDQQVSLDASDVPIKSVLESLSADIGIPILIDEVAFEESGLTIECPVNLKIENVSARSVLAKILETQGLTVTIRREWLEVTTQEVVEEKLLKRIYWLDGLGEYNSNFESLMQMIQTNVEPDAWEELGGSSTMTPIRLHRPNRSGIFVSAKSNMHEEIEELLETVRKSNFGPDQFQMPPSLTAPVAAPVGVPAAPAQTGGMF
jgi:hypothetical protein